MDTSTLQSFLLWCTIINGGLLLFWTSWCAIAPDLVYRTQRLFFPISKDAFSVVIYAFLGLFKVFFLVFNLIPYIALRIVS